MKWTSFDVLIIYNNFNTQILDSYYNNKHVLAFGNKNMIMFEAVYWLWPCYLLIRSWFHCSHRCHLLPPDYCNCSRIWLRLQSIQPIIKWSPAHRYRSLGRCRLLAIEGQSVEKNENGETRKWIIINSIEM